MKAILLLVCLATTSVAAMEEPLASPRSLRSLETVARELARSGRGVEVAEIVELLSLLGQDSEALNALQETCEESLEKFKTKTRKGPPPVPSAIRHLWAAAGKLVSELEDLPPERQRALARIIVRLDDSQAQAHSLLGHVSHGGSWVAEEREATRGRREGIEVALARARGLEIELEPGQFVSALDLSAALPSVLRWGSVTIASSMPEARLARVFKEVLRACAFSHYLRTGELSLPELLPVGQAQVLELQTRVEYVEILDRAVAGELLDEKSATRAEQFSGWHLSDGSYVDYNQLEADVCASLFAYLQNWGRWRDGHERPQAVLRAGHLNWVCLSFFGARLPAVAWRDEPDIVARSHARGSAEDRELEDMLRIRDAGLTGTRGWMQYLVRRGKDPAWERSIVAHVGKVQGSDLAKATMMVEFLQEQERFASLLKASACSSPKARELRSVMEEALGSPLEQLESQWRAWLWVSPRGLAQRLAGGAGGGFSLEQGQLLEALRALRRSAFEGTPYADNVPVELDASLNEGCQAHAEYLALHPQRTNAGPDAHEQSSDELGFSAAGSRAAGNSVIVPGMRQPGQAIESWMGTFYNRLPLLDPGLLRVGWGFDEGVAVMDVNSLVGPSDFNDMVIWPARDQDHVPRQFWPELPNPVPGADQSRWGYPITVQLFGPDRDQAALKIRLLVGGLQGRDVEGYLSTPREPTNQEIAPPGSYGFIPMQTLKANTSYTVMLDLGDGRRESWSFRTGW